MLKGILGILLFVFFIIVFVLMLTGGYIIRTVKKFREASRQAADRQERQFRDETGRQSQQYHYTNRQNANAHSQRQQQARQTQQQEQPKAEEPQARRTKTATGETIIDHRHQERESRKIFDDADGEYVEFTEE